MPLKNVQVVAKGAQPKGMDFDLYAFSSDITTFNVYDQDWETLQKEGLSRLFNGNKADFEQKKAERKEASEEI